LKKKQAFEISEINFSTIPIRYQEAINLLKEEVIMKVNKPFLQY